MGVLRLGVILPGPDGELFTLVDYLGSGSFGEVYLAEGATSNRVLAVKILPAGRLTGDGRAALLNEARLATQLDHPNVVKVHYLDEGESEGPYLMMEYLPDGTLASYLDERKAAGGPPSLDDARAMMIQIAQGARAINELLIHRDIKPDNILREGERLKITDFGIAKAVEESTRTHTFKGRQAICYMAPEGWRLETNTPKTDVYSVGLVFHEILTLQHPLRSMVNDPGDWREWEAAHLFKVPDDIRNAKADVPKRIAFLIAKMLGKSVRDRPEWDEVISTLSSENLPEPVAAPAVSVDRVVEAAVRRRREADRATLAAHEQRDAEKKREELYQFAIRTLVERFDKVVGEVNAALPGDKIQILPFDSTIDGRKHVGRTYRLPTRETVALQLFGRLDEPQKFSLGKIVGGGWLGPDDSPEKGRSANLMLVKESEDDLYGTWKVCRMRLAFGREGEVRGKFRVPVDGTRFGLRDSWAFYEHVRGIGAGGMQVFSYEVDDNVEEELRQILISALES